MGSAHPSHNSIVPLGGFALNFLIMCSSLIDTKTRTAIVTAVKMLQAETRALEVPLGDGRAAAALGFAGDAAAAVAAEREAWQDMRWEGIPGNVRHAVSSGVAAGFQMAGAAGPLCDEPLWGIAFEVCSP